MRKIIIIGDGGHSKVIADVVISSNSMEVYAKLDNRHSNVYWEGGILKGPVSHLASLIEQNPELGVIIGIGSNRIRKKIVDSLRLNESQYIKVVHPTAVISPSVKIGIGTVVMPGTIVNADATVGKHVILNSGSVVEHDCTVGNYCHISPLAALTGGVCIEEGAHVGASASIIPMMKVGEWATVGAGAVVTSEIKANVTVVGAPAKEVKKEGL